MIQYARSSYYYNNVYVLLTFDENFSNYIEFSSKDIKETLYHRQTSGKTENENQYIPTENFYTILWIFLQSHIPYINPVFYIIFCVKLLTSLEF